MQEEISNLNWHTYIYIKYIYKKDNSSWSSRVYIGLEGWLSVWKLTNVILYFGKVKKENDMVISADTEKVFDKILHSFWIKTQQSMTRKELPQP